MERRFDKLSRKFAIIGMLATIASCGGLMISVFASGPVLAAARELGHGTNGLGLVVGGAVLFGLGFGVSQTLLEVNKVLSFYDKDRNTPLIDRM